MINLNDFLASLPDNLREKTEEKFTHLNAADYGFDRKQLSEAISRIIQIKPEVIIEGVYNV